MIRPLGVDHVSSTVADIDGSLRFYRDLLGMTLLARGEADGMAAGIEGARIAWADVDTGDGGILELVQYLHPVGERVQQRPGDPGSGHFAVCVADGRGAHAELVAAGVEVLSAPHTMEDPGPWHGAVYFYAIDPDGQTIEIIERPPRVAA
jgi:catechol 2,3-dioxygenase-like lactoylglutathione lyase family enzyme